MGLFDWLRGSSSRLEIQDDLLWLTAAGRLAGIAASVRQSLAEQEPPVAILLVAHFQDRFAELQNLIETHQFPGCVTATTAEHLATLNLSSEALPGTERVEIVVAERHPLWSRDERIVEFSKGLPCRCRLIHHDCMTDPVVREFAGEWVTKMLKQLGMKEDESFASRMVSRRLQAAQKILEEKIVSDQPADSAEEWLNRNLPNR